MTQGINYLYISKRGYKEGNYIDNVKMYLAGFSGKLCGLPTHSYS